MHKKKQQTIQRTSLMYVKNDEYRIEMNIVCTTKCSESVRCVIMI